MNFYGIQSEFDNMCRTAGLAEMTELRDRWLNNGWEKICEEFVIPAMVRNYTFDSIADQDTYDFPYDYNGTEVGIVFNNRRLDPVSDEVLRLRYEKRTGNMGSVRYYDWSGIVGVVSDALIVTGCTLVNNSTQILCDSTDTRLNVKNWIRFDPYEDLDNEDANNDGIVDPGDYGYLISAGSQVSGVSLQLETPYRGPSGSGFTLRLRPAETQRFIVYGNPTASETDAFDIRYYAKPQRLHNRDDIPEWPNMGMAIAYMGMSICLEWYHNLELSRTFWGRAVGKISGLQKRRSRTQTLVSDLMVGSSSGRRTGLRGRFARSSHGRYR